MVTPNAATFSSLSPIVVTTQGQNSNLAHIIATSPQLAGKVNPIGLETNQNQKQKQSKKQNRQELLTRNTLIHIMSD